MLIHKSCGKRDASWKPTSEIQVGEFSGEVRETRTPRPERQK